MEPTLYSIRVKNFKSLCDTGELEFRPITLLVGPNSSGKTAVLQTLLMLKQTLESRNLETPLVLRGKYVNLGSFRDVIFRHELDKVLEISLGIGIKPAKKSLIHLRTNTFQSVNKYAKISFRIGYDPETDRLVHQGLELSSDGSKLLCLPDVIKFEHDGLTGVYELEGKIRLQKRNFLFFIPLTMHVVFDEVQHLMDRKKHLEDTLARFERKKLELEKLFERTQSKNVEKELRNLAGRVESLKAELYYYEKRLRRLPKHLSLYQLRILGDLLTLLRSASSYLQDFIIERLYYIGPLREYPHRYYVASGEYPRDVGLRGEHTADVIYSDFKKRHDQYNNLRKWIKRMELAEDLKMKRVAEGLYALVIGDPKLGIDVNLADIGFGASQLLPILVQGIYAKDNSVLLIEQPEIHLHPRVQAMLADFFIDIAKQGKQLIVETHSEHLLLRLQRRIAEGKFSSNDLAIYFFETTEKGTHISKVNVTEEGIIEKWPKGFFEEDIEESYRLLKALRERRKSVSSD